jgi:3D (Asp-Asp-Asp) domain-containing protein
MQIFNMSINKPQFFAIVGLIITLVNSHAVIAASFTEYPGLAEAVESKGLVVPKDPEQILIAPEAAPALRTVRTTLSAYNSIPNQTDGSPFVTAAGSCVRDGVVASNAFRIGTKIRFPELFGDKVFVVEDRMNERYTNRIDVWMTELKDARKFGLKHNTRVEVVEEGNGKKFWKDGWTNEKCQQMLADSIA